MTSDYHWSFFTGITFQSLQSPRCRWSIIYYLCANVTYKVCSLGKDSMWTPHYVSSQPSISKVPFAIFVVNKESKNCSQEPRRCFWQNIGKSSSSFCFFHLPGLFVEPFYVSVYMYGCVYVCVGIFYKSTVLPPAVGSILEQKEQQYWFSRAGAEGRSPPCFRWTQVGDRGPFRVERDDIKLTTFILPLLDRLW